MNLDFGFISPGNINQNNNYLIHFLNQYIFDNPIWGCWFVYFSDFVFNANNVDINNDTPQWQNYFQCGFLGLVEHLKIQSAARGMKCMVDGTVPGSSGLSSSSALVCCAALVTMHANGKSLPKVTNIIENQWKLIVNEITDSLHITASTG